MNGIFNNLVEISQKEKIPSIDVTEGVISEIHRSAAFEKKSHPLGIIAAISSYAASIILCFAVRTMYQNYNDDPLRELSIAVQWVVEDTSMAEVAMVDY